MLNSIDRRMRYAENNSRQYFFRIDTKIDNGVTFKRNECSERRGTEKAEEIIIRPLLGQLDSETKKRKNNRHRHDDRWKQRMSSDSGSYKEFIGLESFANSRLGSR